MAANHEGNHLYLKEVYLDNMPLGNARLMGRGGFGSVYASKKAKGKKVIKFFVSTQSMILDYYKIVIKNPENTMFPNIVSLVEKKFTSWSHIVVMEKLYSLKSSWQYEKHTWKIDYWINDYENFISDVADNSYRSKHDRDIAFGKLHDDLLDFGFNVVYDHFLAATYSIADLVEEGANLDLYTSNVMVRKGTNELVITDPIF